MVINTPFIFPIVCWNFRKNIERCLESVFAQSCREFTILLTDDFSTDGTFEIANKMLSSQSKIPYSVYRNKANTRLLSRNRQNHYETFDSIDPETIILNLDGDDFLADRHVVRYYQELYAYTGAYMHLRTVSPHKRTIRSLPALS